MCSIQTLKDFMGARLTAAAVEIFAEFEKHIVLYEEEINRQRTLLDITLNPQIKLHRTEFPQQDVHQEKEEVIADQERNPSLDQETPEIKEEQEEPGSRQEGKALTLKQETEDGSVLVSTSQESPTSEAEPDTIQVFSDKSSLSESQNQELNNPKERDPRLKKKRKHKKKKREDGGKTSKEENNTEKGNKKKKSVKLKDLQEAEKGLSKKKKKKKKESSHKKAQEAEPPQQLPQEEEDLAEPQRNSSLDQEEPAEMQQGEHHVSENTDTNTEQGDIKNTSMKENACQEPKEGLTERKMSLRCKKLQMGERSDPCERCGKSFPERDLLIHMQTHAAEKLYPCNACDKSFTRKSNLLQHRKMHRYRPYSCDACGKAYTYKKGLVRHGKMHSQS